jgi:hypothetical protein
VVLVTQTLYRSAMTVRRAGVRGAASTHVHDTAATRAGNPALLVVRAAFNRGAVTVEEPPPSCR